MRREIVKNHVMIASAFACGISAVFMANTSLADENTKNQNRVVAANYGITQASNLDKKHLATMFVQAN